MRAAKVMESFLLHKGIDLSTPRTAIKAEPELTRGGFTFFTRLGRVKLQGLKYYRRHEAIFNKLGEHADDFNPNILDSFITQWRAYIAQEAQNLIQSRYWALMSSARRELMYITAIRAAKEMFQQKVSAQSLFSVPLCFPSLSRI